MVVILLLMQLMYFLLVEWPSRKMFPLYFQLLKHVSMQNECKNCERKFPFSTIFPHHPLTRPNYDPWYNLSPSVHVVLLAAIFCLHMTKPRFLCFYCAKAQRSVCVHECLQWTVMITTGRHFRYAGVCTCLLTSASLFPLPLGMRDPRKTEGLT